MKTTQKEAMQFGEKWFDEWIEERQNDKGGSVKFLKSLPLSFVISALDTYAESKLSQIKEEIDKEKYSDEEIQRLKKGDEVDVEYSVTYSRINTKLDKAIGIITSHMEEKGQGEPLTP